MKAPKWLLLLILCCPVASMAQTSLRSLPSGKPAFGIGLHSKALHIVGAVEYGLTDASKAIIEVRVPWREDNIESKNYFDSHKYSETHLPAFRWVRIKPLLRGFETFISAGFDDIEFREDTLTVRHIDAYGRPLAIHSEFTQKSRNVNLGVGAGILKHLETDKMVFKPYLGLRFHVTWSTWEDVSIPVTGRDNDLSGHLRVQLGFETEVSSSFTVQSGFTFTVNGTDNMFHLDLNYHLGGEPGQNSRPPA